MHSVTLHATRVHRIFYIVYLVLSHCQLYSSSSISTNVFHIKMDRHQLHRDLVSEVVSWSGHNWRDENSLLVLNDWWTGIVSADSGAVVPPGWGCCCCCNLDSNGWLSLMPCSGVFGLERRHNRKIQHFTHMVDDGSYMHVCMCLHACICIHVSLCKHACRYYAGMYVSICLHMCMYM